MPRIAILVPYFKAFATVDFPLHQRLRVSLLMFRKKLLQFPRHFLSPLTCIHIPEITSSYSPTAIFPHFSEKIKFPIFPRFPRSILSSTWLVRSRPLGSPPAVRRHVSSWRRRLPGSPLRRPAV